ncbi:MAG: C25 family cysteine peptidase, partial [Gammaproteobacteria bacterium]|nr:C25 family cysteine peptidase [Gammaproteobacteria bacterium]
ITSAIFTNQTQTSPLPTGFGEDTILVLRETLTKDFQPSRILTGGVSTLTFVVNNPSLTFPMVNTGFVDTFPTNLSVAGTPNLTSSSGACGTVGVNWSQTGPGQVTLSGVTIPAGLSCTYTVDVTSTVPNVGYINTSNPLTFTLNGSPVVGDTATDVLQVDAPTPRIALQKRISTTNAGPWGEFVGVALNSNVYYQFTVENTGDVTLSRPGSGFWVTDALVSASPMCPGTATLDPGDFFECVVGPITASQQDLLNTATASGVNGGTVTDTDTASYSTKLPDLVVTKARTVPAGAPGSVNTSSPVNVTYQISVFNKNLVTVNETLAPIVIEDTLPLNVTYLGFTSLDPFWSCTLVATSPRHKVSCTYSGQLAVGATSIINLQVLAAAGTSSLSNTAVALGGGDPACIDPNETPASECKGPWFEAAVPVTLSDVSVQIESGQLVVQFGTAVEAGTLGFQVLGSRTGERSRQPISDGMVMASGSSFEPRRYEVRAPYTGQAEVWVEEVATNSQTKLYGPYAVGSRTGERDLFVATDWAAIATEQGSFRQAQMTSLVNRSSGSALEAELRVSATGLVRVRYEDLTARGIDWSGIPARQIRLSRGSSPVPIRYEGPENFGPGSEVYFLGESIGDSQYTRTAVYRLAVSTLGTANLQPVYSGIGSNPASTTFTEVLTHAPNRSYDLSSPHSDPWFAQQIIRGNNVPLVGTNETFVVTDRAANSRDERIEVGVWGGTDYPAAPDHSLRLLLNGTEIARPRFEGRIYEAVAVDLPQGLLVNGTNTLRIELIGDTGAPADVVYLDSIRVRYTRELKAVNDRLAFAAAEQGLPPHQERSDRIHADDFSTEGVAECSSSQPNCATYRVSGLTRADVNLYRADSLGNVEQLTGFRTLSVANGFEVAFSTLESAGDRYWIEPAVGSVTALVTPKEPATDPLAGGNAEYLVISHPSFIGGLAPLVAARLAEGMTVRVIDVERIYDYYNQGVFDPAAIGAAIADAYSRLGTRYVLLVGGDTYDYFNYMGANSQSFVPTFYRPTSSWVRFAPVDAVFADVDADGKADLAIGRFPVRTMAELNASIAKTLAYSGAAHAGKLLTVADRTGQDGVSYAGQLTALNDVMGDNTLVTALSLNSYPAGNAGLQLARS